MAKSIEQIYQEIAVSIAQSVPQDRTTAWVSVEVTGDSVYTIKGWYLGEEGGETRAFRVDGSVSRLFAQLRSLLKREGASSWLRAKFTLARDGEFELEFGYDSA